MKELKDFNTRRELIIYMAEGGTIIHRRMYTGYMSIGKIKSLGKTSCVIEFAPPADSLDFISLPEHLQAKPDKAETHDMRAFSIDTSIFNVKPSSLVLSFNPIGNPFSYLSKLYGHASYKPISDIQNRRELLDLRRRGIVTPEGIRGSLDRVDAKQATIITHMGVSQSFDLPGRLWPAGWKETKRIVIPADATFEILSLRNKNDGGVFIKNGDGFTRPPSDTSLPIDCMLNIGFCVQTGHIAIQSVKRLSDGEVFTVGDIVYTCPKPELINEFVIAGRDITCRFLGFTNYCNLSELRKSKYPEPKLQANAIGSATPVSKTALGAKMERDPLDTAWFDKCFGLYEELQTARASLVSTRAELDKFKAAPHLRQIKTRDEAMKPNITGREILILRDGNLKAGGKVRHIGFDYILIEGCNDAFYFQHPELTFYVLEMPKPQPYAAGTTSAPQGTHGPTGSHTGTEGCSTPRF